MNESPPEKEKSPGIPAPGLTSLRSHAPQEAGQLNVDLARSACKADPLKAVPLDVQAPGTQLDPVMGAIRGGQDARHLLHTLRQGCAPADALLDAIELEHATGDAERLRGFARELQKTLERARVQ